MKIRTIKPEFWESEAVASCSFGARLTFIGLWNMADDTGTGKANSRIVKSHIWPLDDKISSDDVGTFMVELAGAGLIHIYTADERLYYHVTKWDQHQAASYRRSTPQHPAPPDVQESAAVVIPKSPRTQDDAALVSTPEVESAGSGREGKGSGREGSGLETAARSADNNPNQPTDRQLYFDARFALGAPAIVKLNRTYGRVAVSSAMEQLHGFPPAEPVQDHYGWIATVASAKAAVA